jgi:hypothetical protein
VKNIAIETPLNQGRLVQYHGGRHLALQAQLAENPGPAQETWLEEVVVYTHKKFGTRRSIFVCCTEHLYKFLSRSDPLVSTPCGTRPDSTVTWKYLFVTLSIASFWVGGQEFRLRVMEYFSLFHNETLKMKCLMVDKKETEKIWVKKNMFHIRTRFADLLIHKFTTLPLQHYVYILLNKLHKKMLFVLR